MQKQEVADKIYSTGISPEARLKQMRREINNTPGLKEKMAATGHGTFKHTITRVQLLILLEHYGISAEEYDNE